MALYTVVSGNVALAADLNQIVNLLNGSTLGVDVVVGSRIRAQAAGATAASGYVGGTASGAPVSGTFAIGDFVIDQSGVVWVCTAAGTPGTWVKAGVAIGSTTPHDVKSVAAVGTSATASHDDHEHSWATMIATALTWTQLQIFSSGINLPSYNGSSYSGTNYPAVIAFGSKARQLFVASTRNDADANAGDILFNAG